MSQFVPQNKVVIIYRGNLNALGCVRTFGACGIRPCGIHVVRGEDIVSCSRCFQEVHHASSREDALRILEEKYGNEILKPVVISVDDGITQLLDQNYNRLSEMFLLPSFGGVQGQIDYYADKVRQLELADKLGGIRMIGGHVVERDAYGVYMPLESDYPVIVKPLESSKGGKCMSVCRTAEEYNAFIGYVAKTSIPRMLVQHYIEKRTEYVAFGAICPQRNLLSYTVLRNVRQYPQRHGVGCYSEILTDGKAVEFAKRLFEGLLNLGYDGPVDIEIFQDMSNGEFIVNEFNWRCGGRNFVALYTGIFSNIWWAMAKASHDFQIPARTVNDKHGFTIKGECDIFNAIHGNVGKLQWLKEWMGAESHSLIRLADPLPAVKELCYAIRKRVRNVLKRF